MKALELTKSWIFPKRCPVCSQIIKADESLCSKCSSLLISPSSKKGSCKICSLPKELCPCGKNIHYSRFASPFLFKGEVRRALHRIKFRNRTDKIEAFARITAYSIMARGIDSQTDFITFIPMTDSAFRKRGYNQAQLLAEKVGEYLNKPSKSVLLKLRDTPTQHSLPMHRRRGNLLGAFEVYPEDEDKIKGKRILIIDDIVTGGMTMNEAAKTLLIFGAEEVFCAAAAFSPPSKKKRK